MHRFGLSSMLLLLCLAPLTGHAQQSERSARLLKLPPPHKGLSFKLHWDADAYDNLDGGVKRGYATDSVLSVGLGLDTGQLGWWQGGKFVVGLQGIWSTHPSKYAGDIQTLSNLDAPTQRQVSEFWYAQQLGRATVRTGIMDMNSFFDVNDTAGLFTNASFGITPTIMSNVPGPSYPNAGVGAMAQFGTQQNGWLVGAFQGDPRRRSTALKRGAMFVAERDWHAGAGGPQFGLGAWYRRAPADTAPPASDWGAYGNLEQPLPDHPDTHLFAEFGASPGEINPVPYYLAGGIRFTNVSTTVRDIGFAFARAWVRDHSAETSLEATARIPLFDGSLALQPDVQYILHPSGVHPNALVVGVRLHLILY